MTLLGVLVAAASGVACAGDPVADAREWQGTVTDVADGRLVRTTAGSVWEGPGELVEAASIGVAEGDPTQMIGRVRGVAADESRIWVLDLLARAVRIYDADGNHVGDFGRAGDGPGEFSRPWWLQRSDDGRIFVSDGAQGRLHVFSGDGELLEDWTNVRGVVQVTLDGDVFVRRLLADRSRGFQWEMVRTTPSGDTDEKVPFPIEEAQEQWLDVERQRLELMAAEDNNAAEFGFVPFGRRIVRQPTPQGGVVAGVTDRYSLTVRQRDGSTTIVERVVELPPVQADEATWYRRRTTARWREVDPEWVWSGDEIPAVKRAFRDVVPDRSGRIWVLREVAGVRLEDCDPDPDEYRGFVARPCWAQPLAADVFGADGRYLGQVEIPDGMRFDARPAIEGNRFVAAVESSDGVVQVKRYELRVASTSD